MSSTHQSRVLLPLGGHLKFFSLLAVSISIVFTLPLHAQQAPEKKIWDGVFTSNQAVRGKSAFEGSCARCHNVALVGSERGPAIKGPAFLSHWDKGNLSDLFIKIRDTMPPLNAEQVPPAAKLDIVAYLLQVNGFPAGTTALSLDEIENIQIVKRGSEAAGPPNFSLVATVGCLSQAPNTRWILTNASEPAPTKDETATAEALKSA